MMEHIKAFWKDEEGLGTVEIVLILIVLISIALIFKERIKIFFETIIGNLDNVQDDFKLN